MERKNRKRLSQQVVLDSKVPKDQRVQRRREKLFELLFIPPLKLMNSSLNLVKIKVVMCVLVILILIHHSEGGRYP